MESTISATILGRKLSDILNRVHYRGECFIVERSGEPLARISPIGPLPGITFQQLIRHLATIPPPDDRFADDLEEIRTSQPPAEITPWDS